MEAATEVEGGEEEALAEAMVAGEMVEAATAEVKRAGRAEAAATAATAAQLGAKVTKVEMVAPGR